MFTASIAFFGLYRPAYFEAKTAKAAADMVRQAVAGTKYEGLINEWSEKGVKALRGNCTSFSADWGMAGFTVRQGPHDPFLDHVCASFPACPGLDYSRAANVKREA